MNGELRGVFTKLAKLHAKQNFSIAIVVGDLFGDGTAEHELDEISALMQGDIAVPLSTYFSIGNRPLPPAVVEKIEANNDEVIPNLYFLGKHGSLKTSEGVNLVAMGGCYGVSPKGKEEKTSRFDLEYTEHDVRRSLRGEHATDILISNQWPKGIRTGSRVPLPEDKSPPEEVQCLADLCSTLRPRYHISSSDYFFFEREPFFYPPSEENPDANTMTRFISLASYSKASKQKYMYAFVLDSNVPVPVTIPAGATASPFVAHLPPKRKYDGGQRFATDGTRPPALRKRARAPPPGPGECFFCLSNPNIATHLITSIGDESYLTTAKGPLPTADSFPSLGFPGHMLIIPFVHAPTLSSITEPDTRLSTYKEMDRYRKSLQLMLRHRSDGQLGAVTWEVSRSNGIHVHWQFLPAQADMVNKGLVEAAFKVEAENLQYPKFERPTSEDPSNEPDDFFRVWIWDGQENGSDDKVLLLPLSPGFRFDLQFGRRVMAKLLGLEGRINWKSDVQSEEEEERDANAFKESFKQFDFTA